LIDKLENWYPEYIKDWTIDKILKELEKEQFMESIYLGYPRVGKDKLDRHEKKILNSINTRIRILTNAPAFKKYDQERTGKTIKPKTTFMKKYFEF
jgi:hypothetical protein